MNIVVIGAGPQALAFCAYLLRSRPDWRERLVVVDPRGWLTAWSEIFARLEIDVLRSSCVHHPDPAPYALMHFAAARRDELVGDLGSPSTRLFADFCADLVARHGLDEVLVRDRAVEIGALGRGRHLVTLAGGSTIEAERVIVASNPGRPKVPGWLPAGVVAEHAAAADPRSVSATDRIVVIGGGLTAAQLGLAAVRRGARVSLVTRSAIRCSLTDADAAWMNRARLLPYFAEQDWDLRATQYVEARAGSMPQSWYERLRDAAASGDLTLFEEDAVLDATCHGSAVTVRTRSDRVTADRIWLATGWQPDVRHDPLLAPLVGAVANRHGLPVLDASCRLPGTEVHLMGAPAALQIGAFAPNLAGARIAAERIVGSLCPIPARQFPVP